MQELQQTKNLYLNQQVIEEDKPQLLKSIQNEIKNSQNEKYTQELKVVLNILQNNTKYAIIKQYDFLEQYTKIYNKIPKIFRFTRLSDNNNWNYDYDSYNFKLEGYSYDKNLQTLQKVKVNGYQLLNFEIENLNLNQQDLDNFEQGILNPQWIQQHPSMRLFKYDKLPLQENQRQQLIYLLNKQAEISQDFNETCPVQDIVDPELNPNYAYKDYIKKHQVSYRSDDGDSSYSSYHEVDYRDYWEELEEDEQEFESLRSQYQWIPTIFKVDKDANKVQIIGEIHNLPRKGNEELYSILEEVFILQLPMFRKVECLKEVTEFQVVFKSQKYLIKPMQQYEGKWHLEGKTENIKAASVYYIDIDEGFQLDELNFKNLRKDEMEYSDQVDVDIHEQCCLVFENNIPHKFNALKNTTDKILNRLFMNFFIINPEIPIALTESDIQDILYTISIKLNLNTASIIMRFLGFNQPLELAKKQRLQMRQSSHKEINGWGYIYYGNNGGLQYVDTFHTDKKSRIELYDYKQDLNSD